MTKLPEIFNNSIIVNEAEINKSDINAVFKDAYTVRNASTSGLRGAINTGLGKIHKGLQKNKLEVNDLQQAWKEAGYPDDTRDIGQILKDHGFSSNEINKVFANVFGDEVDHSNERVSASPAVIELANYAKKHNLQNELIDFMKKEFADELGIDNGDSFFGKLKKKMFAEDVHKLFVAIIQEEREDRTLMLRTQENMCLGRSKKGTDEQLNELVTLNDVLKSDHYIKLLKSLRVRAGSDIEILNLKNKIITSWKKGMKSRKHYDNLLKKIHLSLTDLIK